MCEFVTINFIEGEKFQTKYQVISFEFETKDCWFFNVKAIAIKVHGKIYEKDQPVKLMGFPKHRIETEGKETYEVECVPPKFYNKLRNKAILTGEIKVQGDDAPPLEDRDLFT